MNFKGAWVEVISAGKHVADDGRSHDISIKFLEDVVRNYDPSVHEAPAVIGHPRHDAPAYGWPAALRLNGDRLEVQFKDVDPEFEQMVEAGRFKKRSASFYVDPASAPGGRAPSLRHIGFLGAQPPAVKGLRDIQFSEGESLTFESANFCEGANLMEKKDEEKKTLKEQLTEYFAEMFGKGKADPAPASFSEADITRMIAGAVKDATESLAASFTEEIKARDIKIAELTTRVDTQSSKTTRGEIASFIESLGTSNLPPALRPGLVDFMETLGGVEHKLKIISFEEKDGVTTQRTTEFTPLQFFQGWLKTLGPIVSFGELLGGLSATAGTDPANIVSPERMAVLREGAGLPAKEVATNAK